jgi:hypothetical protein
MEKKVEVYYICPECGRSGYNCVLLGEKIECYDCGCLHSNYQDRKSYDKERKK